MKKAKTPKSMKTANAVDLSTKPAKQAFDVKGLTLAFKDYRTATESLYAAVKRARAKGAGWDAIRDCAMAAGWSKSHAYNILVILKDRENPDRNKRGGGRSENTDAKSLAESVLKACGGDARKAKSILQAAMRIVAKQIK